MALFSGSLVVLAVGVFLMLNNSTASTCNQITISSKNGAACSTNTEEK